MPSSINSPGYLLDLLCWLQFETLFTVFLGKSWIWRLDVYVKLIRWTGSKISQHELGRYLLNIGTYLGYWFLFPTWQFVCNTNEITYLNYLLKTILQFQYPIFWSIVLHRDASENQISTVKGMCWHFIKRKNPNDSLSLCFELCFFVKKKHNFFFVFCWNR